MTNATDRLLDILMCPQCRQHQSFARDTSGISCRNCGATFMIQDGVIDFIGTEPTPVTPITKVLYWPGIAKAYERRVRPLLCRVATPISIKKQVQYVQDIVVGDAEDLILDIACGTGLFTRPLAKAAHRGLVVGLDISMKMLHAAQTLAQEDAVENVVFVRADVQEMPFQGGVFDGANCCGALHLFLRPDIALANINNVLKDGGVLSCQTFINGAHFYERLVQEPLRRGGGFNFFDHQELRSLLDEQGFGYEQDKLSGTMLIFGAEKTPLA
jgi:ubiquinone/menaquinone biosynthesis C-methylase UbiE